MSFLRRFPDWLAYLLLGKAAATLVMLGFN